MGYCENPCHFHEACAKSAMCHVKMHRPICQCPKGHEGNPALNCTTPNLSKNIKQTLIISMNKKNNILIFLTWRCK